MSSHGLGFLLSTVAPSTFTPSKLAFKQTTSLTFPLESLSLRQTDFPPSVLNSPSLDKRFETGPEKFHTDDVFYKDPWSVSDWSFLRFDYSLVKIHQSETDGSLKQGKTERAKDACLLKLNRERRRLQPTR